MKLKTVFIALMVVLLNLSATAQIDKMREKLNDAIVEQQEGLLTLRFFDAQTGNPVDKVTATLENIGTFHSNALGVVRFPVPEKDGTVVVHVTCKGYITTDFSIEILAHTIFYNRFSLSKKMPIGQLRIVLEWGKRPADIDAHFVKAGDYHISYRNMTVSKDGIARLDRDDRDGYGPETITVKSIDDHANYRFYVHDYSNRNHPNAGKLSKSKANIKVYGNDKLLKTFQIPEDTEGDFWQVFTITNGQISAVNNVVKKLNF